MKRESFEEAVKPAPKSMGEKNGSLRGKLLLAGCRSGMHLLSGTESRMRAQNEEFTCLHNIDSRFSDTETIVRLETDVSGCDVFLFQGLYDPDAGSTVDQNLMACLIAVRALRESGSGSITAVLPYLVYTRQENPNRTLREPTTAKLVADLLLEAGIDRLVTVHPHDSVHALFGTIPVVNLDSLPLFAGEFGRFRNDPDVVAVSPDAGASKIVASFSRGLEIPGAIAFKHRPRPDEAAVSEVIGNIENKRVAIILDDMISGGGTVYAVARSLAEEDSIESIYLGVTHNLCTPPAIERLRDLHSRYKLKEVMVTNSIRQTDNLLSFPFVKVYDLADDLSRVIGCIHHNLPFAEVLSGTGEFNP